jgi:hypothetical protein
MRYQEGELVESSILVFDLNDLEYLYRYEHYNNNVRNHIYDFEYKNGSIMVVEEKAELNVLSNPIYTKFINTSTDEVKTIAEGSFERIINNYDDNFYRISRQNGQVKVNSINTKSFLDQEILLDNSIKINDINITPNDIFITTQVDRRRNISQVTKLNSDGSINFEITGWFNTEQDGLIPSELNEVIVIEGEDLR